MREIERIRAEILERRGGVPLDVDAMLEEMRADRGLHCEGVREMFEEAEEHSPSTEPDAALPDPPEGPTTSAAESSRIEQVSYTIVRSATGGPDHLVIEPDPSLLTLEAREAFLRKADEINAAILKRRKGVPIDVEELLEEMRSERGSDSP